MRVRARRGGRVVSRLLVLVLPYIAVALEGVTPLTNAQQDRNTHRPTHVPKTGTASARESENPRKMRWAKYGSAAVSLVPQRQAGRRWKAGERREPRKRNGAAHTDTDTATHSFRYSQRAGQCNTPQ